MASTGINQGIHNIYIGNDLITHLINVDFDVKNALRKITNKASTNSQDEFLPGTVNYTMGASAFFAEDSDYGFNELQVLCKDGTNFTISWWPTLDRPGDIKYSADCLIKSVGQRSPNLDGSETIDCEFQLTGSVSQTVVPGP